KPPQAMVIERLFDRFLAKVIVLYDVDLTIPKNGRLESVEVCHDVSHTLGVPTIPHVDPGHIGPSLSHAGLMVVAALRHRHCRCPPHATWRRRLLWGLGRRSLLHLHEFQYRSS